MIIHTIRFTDIDLQIVMICGEDGKILEAQRWFKNADRSKEDDWDKQWEGREFSNYLNYVNGKWERHISYTQFRIRATITDMDQLADNAPVPY